MKVTLSRSRARRVRTRCPAPLFCFTVALYDSLTKRGVCLLRITFTPTVAILALRRGGSPPSTASIRSCVDNITSSASNGMRCNHIRIHTSLPVFLPIVMHFQFLFLMYYSVVNLDHYKNCSSMTPAYY